MKRLAALTLVALLSACGGGGGGGGGTPTIPAPVSTQAPQTGTAQLNLVIPSIGPTARRRRLAPMYISSGTAAIAIKINGTAANPNTVSFQCNPTVPSGSACTVIFPAPAGSDVFDLALGDSNGDLLSEGTVTATISAGQTTVLHLTFLGVPAYVHLKFDTPYPPVGTAADVHLSADAYDASGNLIIGDNYAKPVTVGASDPSGHTTLTGTQITSPTSSVTVHYDGKLMSVPATFTAALPFSPNNTTATLLGNAYQGFTTTYPVRAVAKGNDGNIWFTEWYSTTPGQAKVGYLTPSGTVVETPDLQWADQITAGPDGNMWYTEGSFAYVGSLSSNLQITQHLVKTLLPNEAYDATSIVTGSDGNLWIMDSYRLFRMTTAGVVTTFSLPGNYDPSNLSSGPDGAIWFPEIGYVGRMAMDGTYTGYSLPNQTTFGAASNGVFLPDNKLYFSSAGGLQNVTTGGTFSTVAVSGSLSAPYTSGPDGNLWGIGSSPYFNGGIGVLKSGQVTTYPEPNVLQFTMNGGAWGADGNLYFGSGNQVVRFRYDP